MDWMHNDHALHPLPDAPPALSPQALRSALVLAPIGALLWALIIKAIDFLRWAVPAAAGALFVIFIGSAFSAAFFAAYDNLWR